MTVPYRVAEFAAEQRATRNREINLANMINLHNVIMAARGPCSHCLARSRPTCSAYVRLVVVAVRELCKNKSETNAAKGPIRNRDAKVHCVKFAYDEFLRDAEERWNRAAIRPWCCGRCVRKLTSTSRRVYGPWKALNCHRFFSVWTAAFSRLSCHGAVPSIMCAILTVRL